MRCDLEAPSLEARDDEKGCVSTKWYFSMKPLCNAIVWSTATMSFNISSKSMVAMRLVGVDLPADGGARHASVSAC